MMPHKKVPKKLLDDLQRSFRLGSRAMDSIVDSILKFAVSEGYEVLMNGDDEDSKPVFVAGISNFPTVVARKQGDPSSIGTLGVNQETGTIEYETLDMTTAPFELEAAVGGTRNKEGWLAMYG